MKTKQYRWLQIALLIAAAGLVWAGYLARRQRGLQPAEAVLPASQATAPQPVLQPPPPDASPQGSGWRSVQGPAAPALPPSAKEQQYIEEWRASPFVNIQTPAEVAEAVKQIPYAPGAEATDEEKAALNGAITDLVKAYRDGTLEAMTQFRIPVKPYHFIDSISNAMVNYFHIQEETVRNDPDSAWRAWWLAAQGNRYSNCWSEISPAGSLIKVETTNSLAVNLMNQLSRVERVPSLGFAGSGPIIVLEPTAEAELARNGTIKLATVRILPKPRVEDIYPVYVRYYWAPEIKKWLPMGLVGANSRRERKLTYFF